MKKSIQSVFLAFVVLTVLLSGCAPASTPIPTSAPSTFTPSPIPPTFTSEPTATATTIPSPTPFWSAVVPVGTPSNSIPWLPMENTARPGTYFFYFNLSKPPFDNVLVRQAFAAAIDRETLAKIAAESGVTNPRPATTFTPPETLNKDLYNEVGIPFNPAHAKDSLTQAGYADVSKFPSITLLILSGDDASINIANKMAVMWQEYLGVKITVEVLERAAYRDRIKSTPPEISYQGWAADYNDPDNFLREIFRSDAGFNFSNLSNSEFDNLVDSAGKSNNPAERQDLYIQAERILCETEVTIIPIYHATYNIP